MRLWLFGVEDNIPNSSGQGRVIPPDSTLTTSGSSSLRKPIKLTSDAGQRKSKQESPRKR